MCNKITPKLFRNFFRVIAIVVFSVAPFFAYAAQSNGESITSFDSTIVVQQDGSIDVTETIQYFFPAGKHGIYRDIPVTYNDSQGKQFRIPIDVRSVTKVDGTPWQYTVTSSGAAIRIKIGDPDVYVSGAQTYRITYTAKGALRYFSDHDELYWNVTGSAWQVPISSVRAIVQFPSGFSSSLVTTTCYTGAQGSTAKNCLAATNATTTTITANDFLTIVLGWPPGKVAILLPQNVSWLERNWSYFALLIPLVVAMWLFRRWMHVGRDPRVSTTLVVQYDPPQKMRPGEVGVLIDDVVNETDFLASIIDLAVRGYLLIKEIPKPNNPAKVGDYEFARTTKDFANDATLFAYEKTILTTLFASSDSVLLSTIKKSKQFQISAKQTENILYDRMVENGSYDKNPNKVRAQYSSIAAILFLVAVFTFKMGGLAFLAFIFSPIPPAVMWPFQIVVFATAAVVAIAGVFMPRHTARGAEAKQHARGFKEYLKTAEKYRLEWQEKERVFEQFLPYAMVFGVVSEWTRTFAGMTLPRPTWYQGVGTGLGIGGGFNAVALGSALDSLTASASQSSSGSGFSGGSSGGGGGGGGGGSW